MTFGALLPALKAAGCEVSVLASYADEVANYDIPSGMVVDAAVAHRIRNRWSLSDGRWGRLVPMSAEGIAEGLRRACEDFSWCLPDNGFGEIRAALEESQNRTLDIARNFVWTQDRRK